MNLLYLKCGKETLEYQKLKEIRTVEIEEEKEKGEKMLIVEEIRKVYAENYQRSCSSLGFTVCLREREDGIKGRETQKI